MLCFVPCCPIYPACTVFGVARNHLPIMTFPFITSLYVFLVTFGKHSNGRPPYGSIGVYVILLPSFHDGAGMEATEMHREVRDWMDKDMLKKMQDEFYTNENLFL